MGNTDLGWAIDQLRLGNRVRRAGWNGKDMWLALQVPDEHSKMTLPYFYISTAQGYRVPWLPSQSDMLADDWVPAEEGDYAPFLFRPVGRSEYIAMKLESRRIIDDGDLSVSVE